MGPPRSNVFFFGAADDTGAADDRPTIVRRLSDDRPLAVRRPSDDRQSEKKNSGSFSTRTFLAVRSGHGDDG